MAWSVSADVDTFDEAVEWFARRFPVTPELLDALREFAGPRAWTISGVAQLDILLDVYETLLEAIANGTPLSEFKAAVAEKLETAWGRPINGRVELIFRNATQTSYNRGRWRQITDPDVLAVRPFLMFDAILDARTSPICNALSQPKPVTLPASDAFWLSHQPPLHHNCRSSLRSLTEAQAKRRGLTESTPTTAPQAGFGGVDPEWQPDPSHYPPELWQIYAAKAAAR